MDEQYYDESDLTVPKFFQLPFGPAWLSELIFMIVIIIIAPWVIAALMLPLGWLWFAIHHPYDPSWHTFWRHIFYPTQP